MSIKKWALLCRGGRFDPKSGPLRLRSRYRAGRGWISVVDGDPDAAHPDGVVDRWNGAAGRDLNGRPSRNEVPGAGRVLRRPGSGGEVPKRVPFRRWISDGGGALPSPVAAEWNERIIAYGRIVPGVLVAAFWRILRIAGSRINRTFEIANPGACGAPGAASGASRYAIDNLLWQYGQAGPPLRRGSAVLCGLVIPRRASYPLWPGS